MNHSIKYMPTILVNSLWHVYTINCVFISNKGFSAYIVTGAYDHLILMNIKFFYTCSCSSHMDHALSSV